MSIVQPTAQAVPAVKRRRNLTPVWLLTPAGVIIIALVVVPLIFLIFTSFTDFNQKTLFTGSFNIVGFDQYQTVLTDPEFYKALARTFVFTAVLVAGSVLAGMGVAQLMTKLGPVMRWLVTFVLIFAWAMPNVASSVVWKWLFQPGYGVFNWLLTQTRLFGDVTNLSWTDNTWLTFLEIWLLIVWQPFRILRSTCMRRPRRWISPVLRQLSWMVVRSCAATGRSPCR